jgi:hypothetical protein
MNNTFEYTAGYIDGDGCFYVDKTINKKTNNAKYRALLIISSTNKEVLDFFAYKYGGRVQLVSKREKYPGQKAQYHYTIRHKEALNLTKNILPFLVEKRKQAELFCDFINTTSKETKNFLIDTLRDAKHNQDLVKQSQKEEFIKTSSTIAPNQSDYAYFAGFIDAECCMTIQKYIPKGRDQHVFKIQLACNNSKAPIFKWLIERFGGGLNFINRHASNKKHRDQFMWRISSRVLSKVLPKIQQFLRYKKPVCEKLIEFYTLTIPNGGDRQSEAFKKANASILALKLDIVNEVHKLNLKGI